MPYYEVRFKKPVKSTVTGDDIVSVRLSTMTGYIVLHSLDWNGGYSSDLLYASELRMIMDEIEKSLS